MSDIKIQRLHALDGDHDDLGWYAKGHHEEADFRKALEESFWLTGPNGRERYKHPCEADETECRFVQTWWRNVPHGDGMRFQAATPRTMGAYAVTAMLTPDTEI